MRADWRTAARRTREVFLMVVAPSALPDLEQISVNDTEAAPQSVLAVVTNAVITWPTEYYQLAVQQLRTGGRDVPDEVLAHICPAHSENVNFFGVITVDIEAELAKLDTAGWRPLRPAGI